MPKRFNSLTEYINSFETPELQIRALLEIRNSALTSQVVEKEKNELDHVMFSLIFPADNKPSSSLHINKEESLKRLDILYRIQGELNQEADKEHKQWELWADDKYKNSSVTADVKDAASHINHYMTSKANCMHSTLTSVYFELYNSPSFEQLVSQLEDGEMIYDNIKLDKSNALEAFSQRQQYHVSILGNEYTKDFMTQSIDEKEIAKVPGMNAEDAKNVSQWAQFESATNKFFPWMTDEETRDYKLTTFAKAGIWTRKPDEIYNKMGQLNTIYEDMNNSMISTLWDSDDYKKMKDSLKAVADKYKELSKTTKTIDPKDLKKCKGLLAEAMTKATKYAGSHITGRITPNGKKRFEGAMTVVAACNMDSATAMKEIVDDVRGKDSDQKVDFSAYAAKYKIKFDKPIAVDSMKTRDKLFNSSNGGKKAMVNKEYENSKDDWEIVELPNPVKNKRNKVVSRSKNTPSLFMTMAK